METMWGFVIIVVTHSIDNIIIVTNKDNNIFVASLESTEENLNTSMPLRRI